MVRILDLSACSHLQEQLISIWQESFGDSKEYIQNFFEKNAGYTKVVMCEREGLIVSAAYLLPITYIQKNSTALDCYYLYAAATLPAYRGCGYFGHILQFVNEHIKEPVILVPASESLVDYYKGQGFMMWLTEKKAEIDIAVVCKDAKKVSVGEYHEFRKQCLQRKGSMLWDDKMLSYIFEEHQRFGGAIFEVTLEGKRELLMCQKQEDSWQIVETLPSLLVQPPVMANQSYFEAGVGYFNLTMG